MAIVVNTNVSSLNVQRNLTAATDSMNKAMERMSTGLKINTAGDDAAGMAVSAGLERTIAGSKVAQSNGSMGVSMLTVTEGSLTVISDNLLRIRDLFEQAANDTYGSNARAGIKEEVEARLNEVTRLAEVGDFNSMKLIDGSINQNLRIQIGTEGGNKDAIMIDKSVFANARASALGLFKNDGSVTVEVKKADGTNSTTVLNTLSNVIQLLNTANGSAAFLDKLDSAMDNIVTRKTKIGAVSNRIESAVDALQIQESNLTASNSSIKDADIAEESSNFVKYQILQQASASLLTQANQTPSIALSLI
jgi:flagellin